MIWIVKCTDCQGSVEATLYPGERLVHQHSQVESHNAQWWVEVRPEPRSGS